MKRSLLIVCLALGLASAQEPAAKATPQDLASILPANTLGMFEAYDLGGMQRWMKETALGRIWAEPEVQQFVQNVHKSIQQTLEMWAGGLGAVGLELKDFDGIEIRRIGAAVVDFSMRDKQPSLDLVLTLQTRQGADKVAKILEAGRQALVNFLGIPFNQVEMRGRSVWHTTVQAGIEVFFFMKGDRFLMTTQRARMDQLLKALDEGNAESLRIAPRYANIMKRMGADRSALTMFADVRALHDKGLAIAKQTGAREKDIGQFEQVWKTVGLDSVHAVAVADIPAGSGFRTELAITHDEAPRGIFKMWTRGAVNHRFARYAPADCLFYGAEHWDAMPALDELIAMYVALERRGQERVARFQDQVRKALGVDLKEDVIKSLGTDWAAFVGSPPGGGLIPDIAMFISVKDRPRLEKAMDTMAQRFVGIAAEKHMNAKLRETLFRGMRIRAIEAPDMPLAPCWAFGDDYIVIALAPQTIKNVHISRPALAGNPDFRALVRAVPRTAASSTYLDTKKITAWLYNTAVPVLQAMQGRINDELAPWQIALNLHDLPPVDVFTKHLGGTMFYTAPEEGCVRMGFISPYGSPLVSIGMLAAGMAVGAASGMRYEGRREEFERAREAAFQTERVRALEAQLRAQREMYEARIAQVEKQLAELRKLIEEGR